MAQVALLSTCVQSGLGLSHRLVNKKGSRNGGIASWEMSEAGVPKQGLQKDHHCAVCCTMAAAARATAPSSVAGCKPLFPFP